MIYVLPLISLFFTAMYREYLNELSIDKSKQIFYVFIIYLMVVMGFRYRVGIDTLNYMDAYKSVLSFGDTSLIDILKQFEPLNVLVRSLCKSISDEFLVYQLFHVILLNCLVTRFIFRHTKHILMALFFYFLISALYFNTEIMRESLAVGIFINAYDYIKEKKWLKYYLCALLAIGFHTSGLITLFIPLARKIKFNVNYIIIVVVFLLFLARFYSQLELISLYLSSEAGDKLDRYFNSVNLNYNWIIVQMFSTVWMPLYIFYLHKKMNKTFEYENMICMYILFGLGTMILTLIFSRFTNYFVFFYIILLADSFGGLKQFEHKLVKFGIIVFSFMFMMYFQYFATVKGTNGLKKHIRWYPYHSYVYKKMDQDREKNRWVL